MIEDYEEIYRLRKLLRLKSDGECEQCFYCGVPAEEKEHTVPISYINDLERLRGLGLSVAIPEQKIVPTCFECNQLLGKKYYGTPNQRKIELKVLLSDKYRKLIESPDWDDDEIVEMNGRMKEYIVIYQEAKKLIMKRLSY